MKKKKRILINALYPEEKRVAIMDGDTLVDFYGETASRGPLKGNIYKGVVTKVESGIQAAFVDYGPKKHGFLQFREIMPSCYGKKTRKKRPRIQDVISRGQEMLVQVEKDERDTKGASLTTYVSLPGRSIVMMPGRDIVGVSRKIVEQKERERLKDMLAKLKRPEGTGFILRTASGNIKERDLTQDLRYLLKLWARIQSDSEEAPAPSLIYREQDIAVRTVRDYLTAEVGEVLVDDLSSHKEMRDFLRRTMPGKRVNIRLYKGKTPLFVHYKAEDQVSKISARIVHLPSRGYLVFDKAEALTAVDVNSGRSRKEKDEEATALRTNLEAADEVARQLRLRDIGGLIVIDFIDMQAAKNRKDVEVRLKDALKVDKANTEVGGISRFGLIEMTRERMRTSHLDYTKQACTLCNASGMVRSPETVALAALREVHARAAANGVSVLECRLPVESANYLMNTKREAIISLENTFSLRVVITADPSLPLDRHAVLSESDQK